MNSAEINILKEIHQDSKNTKSFSIQYLDLRKAVKKHINSNPKRKERFNNLPPYLKKADEFTKKRMRNSLVSIARLFDEITIPPTYHPGQTSKRFGDVIIGLNAKKGIYANLTPVKKGKASKALSHNQFDVISLLTIYARIYEENSSHIEKCIENHELG